MATFSLFSSEQKFVPPKFKNKVNVAVNKRRAKVLNHLLPSLPSALFFSLENLLELTAILKVCILAPPI